MTIAVDQIQELQTSSSEAISPRRTTPITIPAPVSSSRMKLTSNEKQFDDFQGDSINIIVSMDTLNV